MVVQTDLQKTVARVSVSRFQSLRFTAGLDSVGIEFQSLRFTGSSIAVLQLALVIGSGTSVMFMNAVSTTSCCSWRDHVKV